MSAATKRKVPRQARGDGQTPTAQLEPLRCAECDHALELACPNGHDVTRSIARLSPEEAKPYVGRRTFSDREPEPKRRASAPPTTPVVPPKPAPVPRVASSAAAAPARKLRGPALILEILGARGALTTKELSAATGAKPGAVQMSLSVLKRAGHLVITRDPRHVGPAYTNLYAVRKDEI